MMYPQIYGVVSFQVWLVPDPPANLIVSLSATGGDTKLDLGWSAVVGTTVYEYRYQIDGGAFTAAISNGTSRTVLELGPFNEGEEVCVEVRATTPGGTSAWSASVCETIPISAPSTPTGLSVVNAGGRRLEATWNAVSGATGYKIRYQINGGSWTEVDVGNTQYYLSERFISGQSVCMQVAAYNTGGQSAWSTSACEVVA